MPHSRSIRTQLTLLVLAVTLPLAALGSYVVWSELRLARRIADLDAVETADLTAGAVAQFLVGTRETLEGLATRPQVGLPSCEPFLAEAASTLPIFTNLFVLGPGGEVRCAAERPLPRIVGPRIVGAEDVGPERVGEGAGPGWSPPPGSGGTDDFHVGGLVTDPRRGETVTLVAVPIPAAEGPTAWLGALVPRSRLETLLARVETPVATSTYIADVEGNPIAGRDPEGGAPALPPEVVTARVGADALRVTGPDDVTRVWGRTRVAGAPWVVYAGLPTRVLYRESRRQAVVTSVAIVFLVLLVSGLATGVYRRITRSLEGLVEGVTSAAADGTTSIPTEGPEEVRSVAQAFNRTLAARDRVRHAMEEQSDRYHSILQNASLGIYVSTVDGRILEANPALAEMLGYDSPRELLETRMTDIFRSDTERGRLVHEAVYGDEVGVVDVEWVKRDGGTLPVRLYTNVVRGLEGEVTFEVIVEDLTERKELEEQLRQSQKLEAVGRLAGGVAHDFNNRLTVIQGQAGLLRTEIPPTDPRRESVEAILESAGKAAALTSKLLAFGRKQVAQPRVIDLNETIGDVATVLPKMLGEDVIVELALSDSPALVYQDPGQIEQILLNLVTNARDAMPRGGTLRISTEIRRRSGPGGRGADEPFTVLSVSDTGEGINEEVKAHLFEPFFTTKPRGKGTGLGLSMVYGIVTQAGGDVEVRSTPGEGATFELWLPATDRSPTVTPKSPEAPPSRPGVERTVLVVEDEAAVREILVESLRRGGYRVIEAGTGEEAMTLMRNGADEVDVVVTDVVMPGVRGPELASRIEELGRRVPVIFISGYAEGRPDRFVDGRPDRSFVPKPFGPEELRREIEAILSRTTRAG